MGMRTEHQVDAKAQLMVSTVRSGSLPSREADDSELFRQAGQDKNVLELSEESALNRDVLQNVRVTDGAGAAFSLVMLGDRRSN